MTAALVDRDGESGAHEEGGAEGGRSAVDGDPSSSILYVRLFGLSLCAALVASCYLMVPRVSLTAAKNPTTNPYDVKVGVAATTVVGKNGTGGVERCEHLDREADVCAYVRRACRGVAAKVDYLDAVYCMREEDNDPGGGQIRPGPSSPVTTTAPPLTFATAPAATRAGRVVVLCLWLIILLSLLGTTADFFFTEQLEFMSFRLHLSEDVAGATLMALGNGAPDVFTAWNAIQKASDFPLVLAELLGAAIFISTVVLGAVLVVAPKSPTHCDEAALARDTTMLALSVYAIATCALDRHIDIAECCALMLLYCAYVAFVVHNQKKKKKKEEKKGPTQMSHHDDVTWKKSFESRDPLGGPTDHGEASTTTALHMTAADGEADVEEEMGLLKREAVSSLQNGDALHRALDPGGGVDTATTSSPPVANLVPHDDEPRSPRAYHHLHHSLVEAPEFRDSNYYPYPGLSMPGACLGNKSDGGEVKLAGIYWDRRASAFAKVVYVIEWPFSILRHASIPPATFDTWGPRQRTLAAASVVGAAFVVAFEFAPGGVWDGETVAWVAGVGLSGSAAVLATTSPVDPPRMQVRTALVVAGFVATVAWLNVLASEAVAVLESLGAAAGVSSAVLGVTALAWGNCIGDVVADTAVARNGNPRMAVASVFNSPLFSEIFALGMPVSYYAYHHGPLPIDVNAHSLLAFATVATSLATTSLVAWHTRGALPRAYAYSLFTLYAIYLLLSIAIEFHHASSNTTTNVPRRPPRPPAR